MKKIPLSRGMFAKVDDEDYSYLMAWKWFAHRSKTNNTHYAIRNANRIEDGRTGTVRVHRVLMEEPDGLEIDHIDGNGLNNQKSNLRVATHQQNAWNSSRKVRPSVATGVRFYLGAWRARIGMNGKEIHLGTFRTKEEAQEARNSAASRFRGEFYRSSPELEEHEARIL